MVRCRVLKMPYWADYRKVVRGARFGRSKAVGAHFGLTPKKYQSGETDVTGAISKVGDGMVRAPLYEAATTMPRPLTCFSALKHLAMQVAKRRGIKRARVALATRHSLEGLDATGAQYGRLTARALG